MASTSSSSSNIASSVFIAQTLGLTSAAFLSGHILLLTTPRHAPFLSSSSSSPSPSLPSSSNPRQKTSSSSTSTRRNISTTTTTSSSSLSTPATTNALLSLLSISSFTYLSSKYFMTLNQRKSELYALAAVTVGVVGLGPEVWWWVKGQRPAVEEKEEKDWRLEKEGDGIEGGEGKVEGEEGKEQTWDLVRGLLVFGGGVGAGGWAVWG